MFKKASLLLLAATCLVAVIINSCKKDSHPDSQNAVSDPAVVQAKAWYESTYPVGNTKLNTQAITANPNLSQLIKPDWVHAATYARIGQPVVELPVDASSVKLNITLSNSANGKPVYNKEYSRSSFLLLNNGTGYKAYVMTVIADSSYLKGDLTKLDHNKYNKHDADFSGAVIYSTPKGAFVSGWFYKNGSITGKISSPKTGAGYSGTGSKVAINSLKTNMLNCVDWYQAYYVDGNLVLGDYLGSTGDCSEDTPILPGGGGGGTSGGDGDGTGGGGGIIPPGDPCAGVHSVSPTQSVNSTKEVNTVNPNPPDGSPNPPGDGGFPPPEPPPNTSTPCTVGVVTINNKDIANSVPINDGRPAIDPAAFIKCFTDGKTASKYVITVYVQQPVAGQNDQWTITAAYNGFGGIAYTTPENQILDVGHTFVGFTKFNTDGTYVTQVMGFYPDTKGVLPGVQSPGIIKDDSGQPYNVSYSTNVNVTQFNAALGRVANDSANANYVLSKGQSPASEYNCTDAALTWMSTAGVKLPASVSRRAFNNTPGDYGQALKSQPGATAASGFAPSGHGSCN